MNAEHIVNYMNAIFERQAFEKNYIQKGGDISLLVWKQGDDGKGRYDPNWSLIANDDPVYKEKISQQAEQVTACLISWLECAKTKMISDGYILMPKEPTQVLIDNEMEGKVLPAVMGSHERAVENFKIRYRKMIAAQSKTDLHTTD